MKEITLPLNRRQVEALEALLATGLWGNSIDEVAMRILDHQLIHQVEKSMRTRSPARERSDSL